jgi:diguanylate cyclase (GGDEF)-like protein
VHQVSLAAATILDPQALARVALDESVRIFTAERAFLFLRDPHGDSLTGYLGRDASGADVPELAGYGSTLVQRVAARGSALVVTGGEEGAALGSQSALVHGLRSIMLAPLTVQGRTTGVIYLDSRVAKGVFTPDDVHILTAIANHVALSFETARAAQLDLAVHTVRQQRDLAERLRHAMTDVSGTLDPAEVAARLLANLGRSVPVDAAALLCLRSRVEAGDGLVVMAAVGGDVAAEHLAGAALADLLTADGPVHGSADPPVPLGPAAASWLAIPLVVRGEPHSLLLAGSGERPYTDADVEIAAAIAGQGIAALDNALLFSRIQELAVRDGLTGLYNRRHFADLAAGLSGDRPTAAVMVDIDHFKSINDTHGHPVGDDVIREVAARLSTVLRAGDVICRYGGEEFAVLLPDTDDEQAVLVAGRLHATVGAVPVPTRVGPLPVTVSVGLALPRREIEAFAALGLADGALYEAKRGGRNRVVAHSAAD